MSPSLYRLFPVLLVTALFVCYSWLWGGSRSSQLVPVIPWVWAFLLEGTLCFPQRKTGENVITARTRSWRALIHDPLFYASVVFTLLLIFPLLNRGLCPACDYVAILRGANPDPPVPFSPFCVNVREHYGVMLWFVPVFTAALAARHALQKDGKRRLYELIVWNAAALALFGFIEIGTGAKGPFWTNADAATPSLFFSTFGYPNMAGAFFTMAFALSVGLWRERAREVQNMPRIHDGDAEAGSANERRIRRFAFANYAILPAGLNFFAALSTLSRAAIVIVVVLAVLAFLLTLVEKINTRKNRVENVKSAALTILCGMGFLVVANVFAPDALTKEIDSIDTFAVADRVSSKGQYHARVATAIFKDHAFFGVGGWGYKHFCKPYMTDEELAHGVQAAGGANVHNDYLQFLCEHGFVGFGCLLAVFLALLLPFFDKWRYVCHQGNFTRGHDAPPKPVVLFAPPPPMLWTFLGCLGVLVHACGDCPLRTPAVLFLLFVPLACAEGFLSESQEKC